MRRIASLIVMSYVLSATIVSGQEQNNLALPYGFRLPFLDSGEYVVSASSAYISRTFKNERITPFDSTLTESVEENDEPAFDLNAVAALTNQLLVSTSWSWHPNRKVQFYSDGGFSLAGDVTLVYRPARRFEVFLNYLQSKSEYTSLGKNNQDDKSVRAGFTYFGKF